jgi:hypothetical protein
LGFESNSFLKKNMKKYMLISLALVATMLSSCKKEIPGHIPETPPSGSPGSEMRHGNPANEFNISQVNNYLAFKTIDDYEKLINSPVGEREDRLARVLTQFRSFHSHNEAVQSNNAPEFDKIKDSFIGSILNSDDVIQIGDHIFKIDAAKEKVYALPSNTEELSDLLAENTANSNLKIFSTSDDVMSIMQGANPQPNAWWIFCTEHRAGPQSRHTEKFAVNGFDIRYLTLGIYFSMTAFIVTGDINTYRFDADIIYYKIRCGGTEPANQGWNVQGNYNPLQHCQKWVVYRSMTNLSRYHFRAHARNNSTYPITYSPWLEIRDNM